MARLIVTRPDGQATALIDALQAQGHVVEHRPLIRIEPRASDDPDARQARSYFLDLDLYQHVIAISANAARLGLQWLDEFWPQPPIGLNWYGVGPASTGPMLAAGLAVLQPHQRFDSEGLLALPELQGIEGDRVLIWRGVGGRETLASALRERGATVDYAELYQRQPVAYSQSDWYHVLGQDVWLILSSGQALDIVQQQLPDLADHLAGILVPSERVAGSAREQGFRQVLVPASARDDDTIRCLQQAFNPA